MSENEINQMGDQMFEEEKEELTADEAEARERSEGDYQQDEESDNNL